MPFEGELSRRRGGGQGVAGVINVMIVVKVVKSDGGDDGGEGQATLHVTTPGRGVT